MIPTLTRLFFLTVLFIFGLSQQVWAEEILCDKLTYAELESRQNGIFTINDGCTNYIGVGAGSQWRLGSGPTAQAETYSQGDDFVTVNKLDNVWEYYPNGVAANQITRAVIFVPGGNVDSASYSSLAYNLVNKMHAHDQNILFLIARYPRSTYKELPCNVMANDFPAFELNKIYYDYSNGTHGFEIATWVLGGHSEGGVGASVFLGERMKFKNHGISGIFFLASFPVGSLRKMDLPSNFCTLSLAGADDLVLARERYEEAKDPDIGTFPMNTVYFDMDTGFNDGIHSYMGTYCPLTPSAALQDRGYGAELRYYETAPDPSKLPLRISRTLQDRLIFGSDSQLSYGEVGGFLVDTLFKGGGSGCQNLSTPE